MKNTSIRLVQPTKADEVLSIFPAKCTGSSAYVIAVQSLNASSPMLVTVDGSVMSVNEVQYWNALGPMESSLEPSKNTLVRDAQFAKASSAMYSTELGILTYDIVRLSNAFGPMTVTGNPSISDGIVRAVETESTATPPMPSPIWMPSPITVFT